MTETEINPGWGQSPVRTTPTTNESRYQMNYESVGSGRILATPTGNGFPCPKCGDLNVHLDEVQLVTANDGFALRWNGWEDERSRTELVETDTRGSGRRYSIVLNGWCEECQNLMSIQLEQHKGSTYTRVRIADGADQLVPEDPRPPARAVLGSRARTEASAS